MSTPSIVLEMNSDDEFVIALKRAAKDRQPVIVDTGDEVFEIDAISILPAAGDADARDDDEPDENPGLEQAQSPMIDDGDDPLLGIFGVFSSGEPNDVARDERRNLTDAEHDKHE